MIISKSMLAIVDPSTKNVIKYIPIKPPTLNIIDNVPKITRKKPEKTTLESVLRRIKEKHGDKFDCSEITEDYIKGKRSKIPIICNECSYRWNPAFEDLLISKGCPECVRNNMKRVSWTVELFKEKAFEKHGNLYDYSEVKPEHMTNTILYKIPVKCKCGNLWLTSLHSHLRGSGCIICKNGRWTLQKFIEKSKEIHGENTFDYSLIDKILDGGQKIPLRCNKCNYVLTTTIYNHVHNKAGCRSCSGVIPWTREEFIEHCSTIYPYKFDYSHLVDSDLKNARKILSIKCNNCGKFFKRVLSYFTRGTTGCYFCNKRSSRGETLCKEVLNDLNIDFICEYMFDDSEHRYDFQLCHNGTNYIIEYDGKQHFEYIPFFHDGDKPFEKRRDSDILKTDVCLKNKMVMIRIDYTNNTLEEVKTHILNGLKLTEGIYVSASEMYSWLF